MRKQTYPHGIIREDAFTLASTGARVGKSYSALIAPKTTTQTRKDIKDWTQAQNMTKLEENPKWWMLEQLKDNIFLDAHLKSQYKNRILPALSVKAVLKKPNGEVDDDQTALVNESVWGKKLNKHILDSIYRGFSLVELSFNAEKELCVALVPRENLNPRDGFLYPDYMDDKKIKYREVAEFGKWILEFYDEDDDGLFNSAIPHVLMKRFAQSCFSELAEIYGIPPRSLKTNTQDPVMMARAKRMMQEMAAAAYVIIDENETLEWAKGAVTNGDVYKNLIDVCKSEISLLFQGAIIGQDTKHGNRSKEDSSQNLLGELIDNDLDVRATYWNTIVIPALLQLGVLKGDVTYGYEQSEDVGQLFEMTKSLLQSGKNIDDEWIKEKFGIEVTGDRVQAQPQNLNLDFF